jgi:hypothetical protein
MNAGFQASIRRTRFGVALGTVLAITSPLFGATGSAGSALRSPTFTRDIAPIFQAKFEECHRPGTAAPMSLVTYEQVRPWAKSIRQRVLTRQMPPWHIDKNVGIQEFANDRSLSDEQISAIVSWVDAGAPMGDLKYMPAPKQWPGHDEWQFAKQFGQPELVI